MAPDSRKGFRGFLRQAMNGLVGLVVTLLIVAGISALVWLSYYLWEVNHPGAPWWGFFFHK
jgi:hypothetical protein